MKLQRRKKIVARTDLTSIIKRLESLSALDNKDVAAERLFFMVTTFNFFTDILYM